MERKTPAQLYREKLRALTPAERKLKRLEWRWSINPETQATWTAAAVRVQCLARKVQAKAVAAELRIQQRLRLLGEQFADKAQACMAEEPEEAVKNAGEALGYNARCVRANWIRAQVCFDLAEYEKCDEDCTVLLAAEKADEFKHGSLKLRAAARCKMEKWLDALEDLNALCEKNPGSIAWLSMRGNVNIRLERVDAAINDYSACVDLNKWNFGNLLRRSCAYAIAQNWWMALQDANAAVERAARPESYCHRARVHCCMRNWEEAAEDYRCALEVSPGHELATLGLAQCTLEYDPLPLLREAGDMQNMPSAPSTAGGSSTLGPDGGRGGSAAGARGESEWDQNDWDDEEKKEPPEPAAEAASAAGGRAEGRPETVQSNATSGWGTETDDDEWGVR